MADIDDIRETIFSPDRVYRYTLWRSWDMFNERFLMTIGLNPSTADEERDDPTIRRCVGFAKAWGYGGLLMTNLFAYRSTDPDALYEVVDPVGAENLHYLRLVATQAGAILVAWGCHGRYMDRDRLTMQALGKPLLCLGRTKTGEPRHPLYTRKDTQPVLYYTPPVPHGELALVAGEEG